jgi:gamma-glutamyl-gamma-aminobutyrate hydrolase PuuD
VKPRIGITSGLQSPGWLEDGTRWTAYAEAVDRAGGIPVHLCRAALGRESAVLADLQGLLLSGGNDVDLALYPNPPDLDGENPAAVMTRYRMRPEPDRDEYELALLAGALDRDLPILGICRGCQVLHVGLGGRLVLDIELQVGTRLQHKSGEDNSPGVHRLRITPGSLLAGVLSSEQLQDCNSRHHQAVLTEPGMTVRVTALSPEDGVVEAIEVPGRRWAVGVQWHPEHRTDPGIRERYAPLFTAFINASR